MTSQRTQAEMLTAAASRCRIVLRRGAGGPGGSGGLPGGLADMPRYSRIGKGNLTMVTVARRSATLAMARPASHSDWHHLYERDPTATLTQSPVWMTALTEFTRWRDASRYYEMADGRRYVLPLAVRRPTQATAIYASMPAGWGMGGVVGSHPLRDQDAAAIMADLGNLRATSIRLLPNPLRGDRWRSGAPTSTFSVARYSHVLDLEGGFDVVRSDRFRRTARKMSNRAMRAGLDIERDTTGRLIPVYRELFRQSVDRWAARSREPLWMARVRAAREDPPGKLEHLATTLGGELVTWVAWYRGEPAATDITLGGRSVFAWRAAMHVELGPATNAAYLLQHRTIEDACERGARYYYLGESGSSAGSAMFKERFGAVGHEYPEIRIETVPFTPASQLARRFVKQLIGFNSNA